MPPNKAVVVVQNITRGTTIGEKVRVTRSMLARGRGLMFERSLDEGEGMLIAPCSSIHMFFMRIALDVLYLDREHTIVRTQRNIKPWRIGPLYTRGANYVIELPVGTIDRSQSEVGDVIQIVEG